MNEIKKIIMEEIQNVVKEEVNLLKTKKLEKSLYEAVKTSSKLKQKALESKTSKDAKKYTNKYFISKRVVELAENKLANHHKKLNENTEGEGYMMKAQLRSIIDNATRIYHMIDETDNFEDWLQYKVTIAEDYLRAVNGYIKYYNGENHMKDDEMDDDYELEYDDEDFDDWDDVEEEDMGTYDFDSDDLESNEFIDDEDYQDDSDMNFDKDDDDER